MSNTIALNELSEAGRIARRGTRIDHAVSITVMGNDTWRGPYREQVTTINVSPHGCKYESKHPVMNGFLVIIELAGDKSGEEPIHVRGRVKWVKRPQSTADPFQTAVELEEGVNVWGVSSPPEDWLPYCDPALGQHKSANQSLAIIEQDTASDAESGATTQTQTAMRTQNGLQNDVRVFRVTPIGIPAEPADWRPEPPLNGTAASAVNVPSLATLAGSSHSMFALIAELQQHVERMVSDAVRSVIRQNALQVAGELRTEVRTDAKNLFAELAMAHASETLEQLNEANQESAKTLHKHWHEKLDADLKKATEQLSPILDTAQKASEDLYRTREDLQRMFRESVKNAEALATNSAARMEETARQVEEQLQEAIDARLIWATEELERAAQSAIESAVSSLRESSREIGVELEDQIRERVTATAAGIVSQSFDALQNKAEQVERQFSEDTRKTSRAHLEFVGGALSELAKGLAKISEA
jgi:hypothetical protein